LLNEGQPLELDSKEYKNALDNRYTVSEFKFYMSNIKLRNSSNGAIYLEPESYHLVERMPETHIYEIEIDNIPTDSFAFNELEFGVGVDNAKNYSLDQVGALDPTNNMAWDWNTGYKFLLLEGRFFPENSDPAGLVYHIGGDSNYRTISLPLGNNPVAINQNEQFTLTINVEVSQIFNGATNLDFNKNNVVMFDAIANKVATNYASNMFSINSAGN
ncbi:MAG: MbnP family protein, partial [Bacteroidota bacterium]